MINSGNEKKMTEKQIIAFCRKNDLRAVIVSFKDQAYDWTCYRIERVKGKRIAFTGMIDQFDDPHKGDFFWAYVDEIANIQLRE